MRETKRKERLKPEVRARERAYWGSLRRKYIQNRGVARRAAMRRGINPDLYYQLTYEDWLLLWA